jgi:hypothetical protein
MSRFDFRFSVSSAAFLSSTSLCFDVMAPVLAAPAAQIYLQEAANRRQMLRRYPAVQAELNKFWAVLIASSASAARTPSLSTTKPRLSPQPPPPPPSQHSRRRRFPGFGEDGTADAEYLGADDNDEPRIAISPRDDSSAVESIDRSLSVLSEETYV